MNKQINYQPAFVSQTILENFQQQGVVRKKPSIFGQSIGAPPSEKMLKAFDSAGLTLPEPSIFGLPVSGINGPKQPTERNAKQGRMFQLPKRARVALPVAA